MTTEQPGSSPPPGRRSDSASAESADVAAHPLRAVALDKQDTWLDAQIRTAQEQGLFDNLPGHGKPLSWDATDDLAGEHWLGNHMLKQAGFLPDWLEARKEIVAERPAAEAALAEYREQSRHLNAANPTDAAHLDRLVRRYVTLATALNTRIDTHNHRCPDGQQIPRMPEDATRRWG